MDPASIAIVLAAIVTAIASICVAFITRVNGKKIDETHKQVTVNGGHNSPPTVLDKLAIISDKQDALDQKLDDHLAWHLYQKVDR